MSKILIAEDDVGTARVIERTVRELGHVAIHCSNGRLAWEVLNDNQDIELIITDMLMPELHGQEFIRLVQENANLCHIPVIIVSGVVSLKRVDEILMHGAWRFLFKPINRFMLEEYVNLLFSKPYIITQ